MSPLMNWKNLSDLFLFPKRWTFIFSHFCTFQLVSIFFCLFSGDIALGLSSYVGIYTTLALIASIYLWTSPKWWIFFQKNKISESFCVEFEKTLKYHIPEFEIPSSKASFTLALDIRFELCAFHIWHIQSKPHKVDGE